MHVTTPVNSGETMNAIDTTSAAGSERHEEVTAPGDTASYLGGSEEGNKAGTIGLGTTKGAGGKLHLRQPNNGVHDER
jgi:hypothetical protein